jgi:hypothetical protein
MKFANAAKFDRKSGGAQRRDLQFALMEKRNREAIRSRHFPEHFAWSSASLGWNCSNLQISPQLRYTRDTKQST